MRWTIRGLLILAILAACSNSGSDKPGTSPSQKELPPKDLVQFTLPPAVTDHAPRAQQQFHTLLPLNTPRFQAKVRWAFADQDHPLFLGPGDLGVTVLHSLYLALYQADQLQWSGGIAIAPNRNTVLNNRGGQRIDIDARDGRISFSMKDASFELEPVSLPLEEDAIGWLENDAYRLFYYYYAFPPELVKPLKLPGGRLPVDTSSTGNNGNDENRPD